MPASVRPTGVICGSWIYPDKKNTYQKLKEFLFENENGRTDVVFFSSVASAYEGNDWKYEELGKDDYHYTGGLIDGFSKAILQGSATRAPRKLYASGVFPAYCSNKIRGFDAWNSNTWFNPNPNGVGGFLAGAASYYNNWLYLDVSAKSLKDSGLHFFAWNNVANNTFTSWDPVQEDFVTTNFAGLWRLAFTPAVEASNQIAREDKLSYVLGEKGMSNLIFPSTNLLTSTNLTVTATTTPEQPQRFWDKEQPWYVEYNNKFIVIGIGYLNKTTGLVETVFPDASFYGYTPNGFALNLTKEQVQALDSDITFATFGGTNFTFDQEGLGDIHWVGEIPDYWNRPEVAAYYSNKQVIAKRFSIETLSTLFGNETFNILPNNATLNSYSAWKNVDGFRLNSNFVIMRSQWANAFTILEPSNYASFETNVVRQKYGLCTETFPGASSTQRGLPVLFYWGTRDTLLRKNAWNNTELAFPRNGTTPQANPLYGQSINGFPVNISTLGPIGFFVLDNSTRDDISAGVVNTELFKSRGLTIKTDLGLFFDTVETKGGGSKAAFSKLLTTTEKNNILGIFKSNNLKYVVNSYVLDLFSDEFGDVSGALSAGNIVLTTLKRDVGDNNPSLLGTQSNITSFTFTLHNTPSNTTQIKRKANYNRLIKTVDLSTTNANWTVGELRFSFLGDGGGSKTKGNFMITSHYVVDPNCSDGIAFSCYSSYLSFRTGDEAYRQVAGWSSSNRNCVMADLFKTLLERQSDPALGGSLTAPKKLVLAIEVGVWETANTNFTYNGVNTWQYLIDNRLSSSSTVNGNIFAFNTNFRYSEEILNIALMAGFKREEIVIWFFTPSQLTTTSVQASGTIDGFTLSTEAEELAYIRNSFKRTGFIRASEIFSNTFLPSCGLFNPCNPWPLNQQDQNSPLFPVKNAVYTNLGSIPILQTTLTNVTNWEDTWYHKPTADTDPVAYTAYSESGALAIGSLFMDYIEAGNATVNFVPPWIPTFSKILNYDTDPVSNAPLQFTTVSTEGVDLTPYFVEYDALCDQGNVQAKRTLARYIHKIIQ